MKYIFQVIVFIFLLISSIINLYFVKERNLSLTVAEVVDGDTFQLTSGKRVRLMGVDAPEYNRCGGKEARELLSSLILKKQVIVEEEVQETFGRSLALVYTTKWYFVKDLLVNKIIMEKGWARPDYRKNSQREVLTAVFHTAKDNNLGLWGPLCRSSNTSNLTNNCLIKGNIDKATYKKYYHLPGCKQYSQIIMEKDIGEQYFCTEDEATRAGFLKSAGCP
ncbi:thermonuclease family protein [Candidatus Roizmanbacteria bacterium]|nr:thermonuclease family protein [Candidatus Roizmanbacteria bacterium]